MPMAARSADRRRWADPWPTGARLPRFPTGGVPL